VTATLQKVAKFAPTADFKIQKLGALSGQLLRNIQFH